jgi:cardiolipin synthase
MTPLCRLSIQCISQPMVNALVLQIPNTLTTLRLLLSIPICLLLLDENYAAVLWLALAAGISDGLDGWLARRLDATSRYGAILDPLSDKALLSGAYACFALVGLLPWWVAIVVVGRDIFIVCGALLYHAFFGRYEMQPSSWGKGSTFVQILFALALIAQQVEPVFPEQLLDSLEVVLILAALASGAHYAWIWGTRALPQGRRHGSQAD